MVKDTDTQPLSNMLFDPEKFQRIELSGKKVECKTNKDLSKTSTITLYSYELSNTIVFSNPSSSVRSGYHENLILRLSIPDINSTEVSLDFTKWYLTIKTPKDTIGIGKLTKQEADSLKQLVDAQKEREALATKSKKITFTSDGSTKTLTICPYSPVAQDDEEISYSLTLPNIGYIVTNYRVWKNHFFGIGGISLTHDEYDEVIAQEVTKRREEDIVGGVSARSSFWNLVTPAFEAVLQTASPLRVDISQNKSYHHASSIESEFGDIVFMNNGKQVMAWHNLKDPDSIVKLINSAKTHFSTTPTTPSPSGVEDPMKALKLRFAKGEITKEEFLEMKSMLE
jgi:hypothetical protein